MCLQQIVLFLVTFLHITNASIRIGGLFNSTEENEINVQEHALIYALQEVTEKFKNFDLSFETETKKYLTERNAFDAGKSVCALMELGVAGIFGPQFGDTHYTVQAICDSKEIPHVLTRWELDQREDSCSINLYPYPKVLSQVFADVVKKWEWNKYLILYEDRDGLLRISTLIKAEFGEKTDVHLRKLVQDESKSYRRLLRNITETGIQNIILDCSVQLLPEILRQAQQVGLMSAGYNYMITNLDFHTLDLEQYMYGGTNITAFRLFNPEDENVMETIENLTKFIKEKNNIDYNMINLPLDAVLIIDAVHLFTNATLAILDSPEKRTISPVPCSEPLTWPHGYSIINHMRMSTMNGLTGAIKFDHQGFRSQFTVQILELKEDGLKEVGKWTPTGVYLGERHSESTVPPRRNCNLRNMTFNVIFPLTSPYGMLVKSHTNLRGNERYEGFCIDLINELSRMSYNFSINFIASKSSKSGNPIKLPNKTIRWDGMVGSIVNDEADLACGDLTITKEREEAVDFTSVFMNLGVAILYKKPKSESPGFFSFLSPFKPQVWILVVTAYVGVSLLFFVMGRISPYEWTNPFPCVQEPDELENQFTLTNSFWFTVGALMQQGSEIAPIAVSTRVAAGIWWFFTLIMVACYTANLAAFLTTENPNEEFTNVEELAKQTEIKYGAKKDGATFLFFNESSELLHKQMFHYMMVNEKDVLVDTTPDGVRRAETEKYAFLMESSQIEYEIERKCSLKQIGKQIDDKGYGIAMKKGSCYLGTFSQNILKMQEDGRLADLKRKWWKEKYAGTCAKEEPNDAEKLGLSNVGGVFLVLGLGVGVAFLVAIIEQFIYVWNLSREEDISIKEHLRRELTFFLQCHGTTKPVSFENSSDRSDDALSELQ